MSHPVHTTIDGLVQRPSPLSARQTADRVESLVRERGLTVFARIDPAAGAEAAGLALRPTELFIVGNAMGGTPLMVSAQTAAIDLPLKILVWEDEAGQVWLGYNDPVWIAQRHGAADSPVGLKLRAVLQQLAEAAVQQT